MRLKREKLQAARARVFDHARRVGHVTNAEAVALLGGKQGYYHLDRMRQLGYLRRKGRNMWVPDMRRRAYA